MPAPPARIRALALGIFRHADRILVEQGYDPVKDQTFYRPLGGGIEFGERGGDALAREIREELGAEITQVTLLGVLENLFVFNGQPGHEIVLLYAAAFADPALVAAPEIAGTESNHAAIRARWLPLDFFVDGPPLYPEGLVELLRAAG